MYKNKIILAIERSILKTDTATEPKLYGLPKIHKEWYPLKPISSSDIASSMDICLINILNRFTQYSKYNVNDSVDFKNKIENLTLKNGEKMVTFDVVFQLNLLWR